MLIGIIIVIFIAVTNVIIYVIHANKKAEKQKYYDAAYKIIKESCLNNAIRNQSEKQQNQQKYMLYLKWKDHEKQGYVFDPEKPVWIGRNPEVNDICIRENAVSSQHCVLFLHDERIFVKDLNSRNGTWIKRGLSMQQITGTTTVFSGDRILVGNLKIEVTVFVFDMAYM